MNYQFMRDLAAPSRDTIAALCLGLLAGYPLPGGVPDAAVGSQVQPKLADSLEAAP